MALENVMRVDGGHVVGQPIMSAPTNAVKNANYVGESYLKILQIGNLVNVSGRFQVTTQKPATQTYYLFSQLPLPAGHIVPLANNSNVQLFVNTGGYISSNDAIDPGYYNVQCTYAMTDSYN